MLTENRVIAVSTRSSGSFLLLFPLASAHPFPTEVTAEQWFMVVSFLPGSKLLEDPDCCVYRWPGITCREAQSHDAEGCSFLGEVNHLKTDFYFSLFGLFQAQRTSLFGSHLLCHYFADTGPWILPTLLLKSQTGTRVGHRKIMHEERFMQGHPLQCQGVWNITCMVRPGATSANNSFLPA